MTSIRHAKPAPLAQLHAAGTIGPRKDAAASAGIAPIIYRRRRGACYPVHMSFFGDSRPRITEQEFVNHVRPQLYRAGFTHEKLDRLQSMFESSLDRTAGAGRQRGIYADELEHTMSYMRAHPDATHFQPHQLDLVHSTMSAYLEHH
jgi:hypothetical protein